MKLYFAPKTRALRPRWLLEELQIPYELVSLNLTNGELKTPEYMKIHPLGKVPALVDGEIKVFESAAICLYLADKYADKKLAPAITSSERAAYYQWMFFCMTSVEPPLMETFNNAKNRETTEPSSIALKRLQRLDASLDVLARHLKNRPTLLSSFSAADIVCASILDLARAMKLLEGQPVLLEYVHRLKDRPAYQRSRADN